MNPSFVAFFISLAFFIFGALFLVNFAVIGEGFGHIAKSVARAWRFLFPSAREYIHSEPAPTPVPKYPQWNVNFTDGFVEVRTAVSNSSATINTKFTSEQARAFARNLVILADSLDKATSTTKEKGE